MSQSNVLAQGSAASMPAERQLPAKQVFLAWEKLRVIYILALAAVTAVILRGNLARPELWVPLVLEAVAANVCFFVGPVGELYLTWLGLPRTAVRYGLFIAGTIFAVLLAWWILAMRMFFMNLPQAG